MRVQNENGPKASSSSSLHTPVSYQIHKPQRKRVQRLKTSPQRSKIKGFIIQLFRLGVQPSFGKSHGRRVAFGGAKGRGALHCGVVVAKQRPLA